MTARRLGLSLLVLSTALGGCGQSSAARTPNLATLPLLPGSQITAQVKRCDKGANAYCAWELVVVNSRYRSSHDLVHYQHSLLLKSGWSGASADSGEEHAADSPGHKMRVTYATAAGDLKGIDLGSIKRPRTIALALSRALFNRSSAMSVLLEVGPS